MQGNLNRSTDEDGNENNDDKPSERTKEEMKKLEEFERLESVFERLSPSAKDKYNLSPVENYDEFEESGQGFVFDSQRNQPRQEQKEQQERPQGGSQEQDTPRPTDVPMRTVPVFVFEKIEDDKPYEPQGLRDVPMSPIHEETAEYEQVCPEFAAKPIEGEDEEEGKEDNIKQKLGEGSGTTEKDPKKENHKKKDDCNINKFKPRASKLSPSPSIVQPEWDPCEQIQYEEGKEENRKQKLGEGSGTTEKDPKKENHKKKDDCNINKFKPRASKLSPSPSIVQPEWDPSEQIQYTKPGQIVASKQLKTPSKSVEGSPTGATRNGASSGGKKLLNGSTPTEMPVVGTDSKQSSPIKKATDSKQNGSNPTEMPVVGTDSKQSTISKKAADSKQSSPIKKTTDSKQNGSNPTEMPVVGTDSKQSTISKKAADSKQSSPIKKTTDSKQNGSNPTEMPVVGTDSKQSTISKKAADSKQSSPIKKTTDSKQNGSNPTEMPVVGTDSKQSTISKKAADSKQSSPIKKTTDSKQNGSNPTEMPVVGTDSKQSTISKKAADSKQSSPIKKTTDSKQNGSNPTEMPVVGTDSKQSTISKKAADSKQSSPIKKTTDSKQNGSNPTEMPVVGTDSKQSTISKKAADSKQSSPIKKTQLAENNNNKRNKEKNEEAQVSKTWKVGAELGIIGDHLEAKNKQGKEMMALKHELLKEQQKDDQINKDPQSKEELKIKKNKVVEEEDASCCQSKPNEDSTNPRLVEEQNQQSPSEETRLEIKENSDQAKDFTPSSTGISKDSIPGQATNSRESAPGQEESSKDPKSPGNHSTSKQNTLDEEVRTIVEEEAAKPKKTPWGFIGGAFGKFLVKLKPKNQGNEAEDPRSESTKGEQSKDTALSSTTNKQQLQVKIPSAGTEEPHEESNASTTASPKQAIAEDLIQCEKVEEPELAPIEEMFDASSENHLNHQEQTPLGVELPVSQTTEEATEQNQNATRDELQAKQITTKALITPITSDKGEFKPPSTKNDSPSNNRKQKDPEGKSETSDGNKPKKDSNTKQIQPGLKEIEANSPNKETQKKTSNKLAQKKNMDKTEKKQKKNRSPNKETQEKLLGMRKGDGPFSPSSNRRVPTNESNSTSSPLLDKKVTGGSNTRVTCGSIRQRIPMNDQSSRNKGPSHNPSFKQNEQRASKNSKDQQRSTSLPKPYSKDDGKSIAPKGGRAISVDNGGRRQASPTQSPSSQRRYQSPVQSPLVKRHQQNLSDSSRPSSGERHNISGGGRIQSPLRTPTKCFPAQTPKSPNRKQLTNDSSSSNILDNSSLSSKAGKQPQEINSPLRSPSLNGSRIPTKSPAFSPHLQQRTVCRQGGRPGRTETSSSPSMGRGRSPTKRDTTHGLTTRALDKMKDEKQKGKLSDCKSDDQQFDNGNYRENQQTREVDLDSLDSQRSTESDTQTGNKTGTEKPSQKKKQPQRCMENQSSNQSTPKKSYLLKYSSTKNGSSKPCDIESAPPKRIVCYYGSGSGSGSSNKIPTYQGKFVRQSSISSVDSLFSVSSYGDGNNKDRRTNKAGEKIPDHQPQSGHNNKKPINRHELFNKENALASGHNDHHPTERHPKLETAVERQRYIDGIVSKSGGSHNKKSKKPVNGIVKCDSPGFMEYAHNAPKTSSCKTGQVVKVSPKIMDSPYRCQVTQAPSDDVVESMTMSPLSMRKNHKKDPYAHIQSPTKKLMQRNPDDKLKKPREASPRKPRSPVKNLQGREESPTMKNHQQTTRGDSKIPYVSPYRQLKKSNIKPTTKKDNSSKNILMFSYDPNNEGVASSSSEGDETSKDNKNNNKPDIFSKERNWRSGGSGGGSGGGEGGKDEQNGRATSPKNKKKLHEKQFAVSNLLGDKPGKVTTTDEGPEGLKKNQNRQQSQKRNSNRNPRPKSVNDIPAKRTTPRSDNNNNSNKRHRSLESPRDFTTKPCDYNERRRRSLIRQKERDERIRNLRNQYNAEKSQFVEHALHPQSHEIKLSHSYPSYTRPTSRQPQNGYDHLRGYGDSISAGIDDYSRKLPDLPVAAPELTQSMNNNSRPFRQQADTTKRLYPGLSNSYDHLNFNYHSPYYRSRSTPAQLGLQSDAELSHSFDARELRETWCPSDYIGYVESRGKTRGYMSHIERLDKFNRTSYNNNSKNSRSRSSEDLLEGMNYNLKAPYATANDEREELLLPNVPTSKTETAAAWNEPKINNNKNTRRDQVEEDLINFSHEAILGDDGEGNTSYGDELFKETYQNKEEGEREQQQLRKQRYLKEDLLRRGSSPQRKMPPPSQVQPLKGAEKSIPKCPAKPSNIPYHMTMEGDYVPRSTPVLLPDGDEYSQQKQQRGEARDQKEEQQHHVSFKPDHKLPTKAEKNKENKCKHNHQEQNHQNQDQHHTKPTTTTSNTTSFPVKTSETVTLPALSVTAGKPHTHTGETSYISSIDNGQPYVDKVFQNTSNSLIQNGIMPYNFFPIICSSHLPKKVVYPFDEQDLATSTRSKSKSPERSKLAAQVESEKKKKRSRSHSPRSLRDSVLLKRQRNDSKKDDELDGSAVEANSSSNVPPQQPQPQQPQPQPQQQHHNNNKL